jgi:filamentous hemagglutinin family protein
VKATAVTSRTVTSLARSAGLVACLATLNPALAAPAGGTVTAGNATITSNAATTTINQTSDRAVINWSSFNIGATETVTFAQPNAQAAVLNRVTGSQLSSLQGTLNANGQVYLVNPNGVLIGSGAHVNVASFIATTASIADNKFMTSTAAASGRYDFNELTSASSSGTIVNEGTITVAEGGIAALVAPAVKNTGIIAARLGTIELASATRFTLDLFGDDLVRVAVGDSIGSALTDVQGNNVKAQVNAGGQLQADGGRIVLLAVPAATGIVDDAINLSGIARAVSVAAGDRGEIMLLSNQGRITIRGTADASASGEAIGGGNITAIGREIRVTSTGRINASAAGDGGSIVLGGTYSADGATATNTTTVDAGAVLLACGTVACATDGTGGAGAGGKVRLYSTNGTRLAGSIDVSSSADKQAGTVELLSNEGLTELASTSRIRARSGVGSFAGFVIGVGETLSVSPDAFVDLRDVQDGFPIELNRAIYDGDANTPQYGQSPDDDGIPGPDLPRLGTDSPLVFHAYANKGLTAYDAAIPALGINLLASSLTTPVGTVRPNGGAPMTLAASGAGTLAAIPVSFANAPLPPPVNSGNSGNPGNSQVADTVSRLALDTFVDFFGLNVVALPPRDTHGPLPVMAGGPGVARSADLGRDGDAAGAAADVFGVNYHVLAPESDKQDPGVYEYLCKTPYSHNGCKPK